MAEPAAAAFAADPAAVAADPAAVAADPAAAAAFPPATMHASHARRVAAVAAAVAADVFCENDCVMFFDTDQLHETISHIQSAGYPTTALHTVAVKANPVGKLLQVFRDRGMGAEAASLGELAQALAVGFPPDRIVFDSPAKTLSELRYALAAGVAVNLDNFQELTRTEQLLAQQPELLAPLPGGSQRLIGLRINPQVGEGSIAALSTGGAVSKFGFPLQEARAELLQAFVAHPWLNMLHLHVGSQGLQLSAVIAGIEAVWGLLQEVEQQCGTGRVRVLDIGGGLSVDFTSDEPPKETLFQLQARLLRQHIPALFSPDCHVRLATENGRSLLAKAGCVASRVEYTKWSGGRHIAVTHVGADLCMRACYLPETWALRVFLTDSRGRQKVAAAAAGAAGAAAAAATADSIQGSDVAGAVAARPDSSGSSSTAAAAAGAEDDAGGGVVVAEAVVQDVAGPLCFQGDRLAVAQVMPKAAVGDFVVVADTGAYTLSMYSRYNSRCSPPVWGYSSRSSSDAVGEGGAMRLQLLRAGETLEQVLHFWNQL